MASSPLDGVVSRPWPGKGVMFVQKPLDVLVKELLLVSKGVSKGLVEMVVPLPKPEKPKWCKCIHCGAWHYLAR